MTAFKYWNGAAWVPIAAVPGPAGPAGVAGAVGPPAYWANPNAPPSTSYLWVDTDAPSPPWLPPTFVSVLPVAPVDGQEVYFQNTAMAAQGVVWHLRYRSAAGGFYKWECLGGSPLEHVIDTSEVTNSATYADLATVGPTLTAPLAGDYDMEFGAFFSPPSVATYYWMAIKLGTAATADSESIQYWGDTGNEVGDRYRGMRRTVASGAVVKAQYKSGSGNIAYQKRRLAIRPVRVSL